MLRITCRTLSRSSLLVTKTVTSLSKSVIPSQSRSSNSNLPFSVSLWEEDNNWVLNILENLVSAVLDVDSQLKSLDITGSGISSVDWASLSPGLLAQVLVSLEEGRFGLYHTVTVLHPEGSF